MASLNKDWFRSKKDQNLPVAISVYNSSCRIEQWVRECLTSGAFIIINNEECTPVKNCAE